MADENELIEARMRRALLAIASGNHDVTRDATSKSYKVKNRKKEYEYSVKYTKGNKCVGMSAYHYKTKEQAHNDKIPMAGEKAVVVRREVGEWEEVGDDE